MTDMYQTEQNDRVVEIPAINNDKDIAQINGIIKELRTRVNQLTQELEQSNQQVRRLNNRVNSLINEVKRIESMRR